MDRPNKNVARGEATRGQLIAIATRMFAERGYEDTSIEAVLREAGVSRGSLYHHFPGKEALFEAVAEDVETSVGEQTLAAARGSDGPVAALRAGSLAWIRLAGDPVVRRILLIDAPSVLGWERWRAMEEHHALGGIRAMLQVIADAGQAAAGTGRHARQRAARVGQRGGADRRPGRGQGGGDAGRRRHHRRAAAAPVRLTGQPPVSRGHGPPGLAAGEQAAAEEGALQRPVAVHPAAAEAGHLAGRVQARDRGAVRRRRTRPDRSVCRPPSVLRVRMLSRTAISGPAVGSRILCGAAVRLSRVAAVGERVADRHDLEVLGVRVVDLPVAGVDLPLAGRPGRSGSRRSACSSRRPAPAASWRPRSRRRSS